MKLTKSLSIVVLVCLVASSLIILKSPVPVIDDVTAHDPYSLTEYPEDWKDDSYYYNSDVLNLWCRQNGSDPGFPLPYSNQTISMGANYFKTKSFTAHWNSGGQFGGVNPNYTWNGITNTSFWGDANSEILIHISGTSGYATAVADNAVIDQQVWGRQRFIGMLWDDFGVGGIDPVDLAAVYDALHHEDANLTTPLKLFLVCYERDYWHQNSVDPAQWDYDWTDYQAHFDGISFWFYPQTYGDTFWTDWNGFTDSFYDMRAKVGLDKEIWAGYYLHYWNQGTYPYQLSSIWINQALAWYRYGYVTKIQMLENQWIKLNIETSNIVRQSVENEFNKEFLTSISTGNVISSYSKYIPTTYPLVSNLVNESTFSATGLAFYSDHLQNVVIHRTMTNPNVVEIRTGKFVPFSAGTGQLTFVALPNEGYRVFDQAYPATLTINAHTVISTPTVWEDKTVTINSWVDVTSSLTIRDCRVIFSNDYYNSAYLAVTPNHGITVSPNGQIGANRVFFEPQHRMFPYYLNLTNVSIAGKSFVFNNCSIQSFAGWMSPRDYLWMNDTIIGHPCPNGATYYGFQLYAPSQLNSGVIKRCHFYLDDQTGATFYMMPGDLPTVDALHIDDITIIGGTPGMLIDPSASIGALQIDDVIMGYQSCFGTHDLIEAGGAMGSLSIKFYSTFTVRTDIAAKCWVQTAGGITLSEFNLAAGQSGTADFLMATADGAGVNWNVEYPLQVKVRLADSESLDDYEYLVASDTSTTFADQTYRWGDRRYLNFTDGFVTVPMGLDSINIGTVKDVVTDTGCWIDSTGTMSVEDTYIGNPDCIPFDFVNVSVKSDYDTYIAWIDFTQDQVSMEVESTNASDNEVTFRISGLDAGEDYTISIDDHTLTRLHSNETGFLTYTYTGEWSLHQFDFVLDDTIHNLFQTMMVVVMVVVLFGSVGALIVRKG